MTKITIKDGCVHIVMKGVHKILALKSSMNIPLGHIKSIEVRPPEAHDWFHGLKVGTNYPGVVTDGTFFSTNGTSFFNITDADKTIALHLHDETYQHVYVQAVDETPEALAQRIQQAVIAWLAEHPTEATQLLDHEKTI